MPLLRWLLPLLLLPFTVVNAADLKSALQPFEAHYKGRANGMAVGDLGVRELKSLGDNRYQLEYRAEAMIYSLVETSVFRLQDNTLQPLSYRSNRGSFFRRRKTSLDFDWATQTGSYDYKGRTGTFALEANVQDPLSGSLYLATLLATDKTLIEYREAEKRGIGTNQLKLIDRPQLQTVIGTIPTWHLERIHRDSKRKTEIWLHGDYPSIPVKVHQLDDGDEFELELTSFTLK